MEKTLKTFLAISMLWRIFVINTYKRFRNMGIQGMSDSEIGKGNQDYDGFNIIDPNQVLMKPNVAGKLLGLTTKTIRNLEDEFDLDIARVAQGAVATRMYSPENLFNIVSLRRSRGQLKGLSRPVIISTYVQKGGTGKTTMSVNLAIGLAMRGLKVLLIDNDPQGDASSMLGYDPDLKPEEMEQYGVSPDRAVTAHLGNLIPLGSMFNTMPLNEVVKMPFGVEGPHLIPADDSLDEMDTALRAANGADFRYSLFFNKATKGQVEGCDLSGYDVILLDNAPSTSLLSRNAMIAADMIICPIRMDKFSIKALTRLQNRLVEFEEDFNRSSQVIAVPTMFVRGRPRALANLARVTEIFGAQVSETTLFHSEDYSKALEESIPLYFWKSATESSQGAMRELSKEIHSRINKMLELEER
jgi:cellulose biosynthesis protein BcsQ